MILPVFMILVLGMFTGGLAYSTKLSLDGAAREGARYGATLAVADATCSGSSATARWLQCVANAAEQAATGDLDAGQQGRRVCVAYVYPDGTLPGDRTANLVVNDGGSSQGTSTCFADGQPNDVRRVQVQVTRVRKLEAMVWSTDLDLNARAITRFEAVP